MLVSMDGGGTTAGGPGAMTFLVDPDRPYATANQFADAGIKMMTWVITNRDRFAIKPRRRGHRLPGRG